MLFRSSRNTGNTKAASSIALPSELPSARRTARAAARNARLARLVPAAASVRIIVAIVRTIYGIRTIADALYVAGLLAPGYDTSQV